MSEYNKLINGEIVPMTAEEIAARQAEEKEYLENLTEYKLKYKYKDDRKSEFISLDGEGMDAIRKAITAISNNEPVPEEFTLYMDKVNEIKNKYPKPEAK